MMPWEKSAQNKQSFFSPEGGTRGVGDCLGQCGSLKTFKLWRKKQEEGRFRSSTEEGRGQGFQHDKLPKVRRSRVTAIGPGGSQHLPWQVIAKPPGSPGGLLHCPGPTPSQPAPL